MKTSGAIHEELRGRGTVIFRLRFRLAGRQRVKYLGTDAQQVERIRAELEALQKPHQMNRRLRRLDAAARAALRRTKLELEPHLDEAGLKFHGRTIRRPR